MSTVEAVHIHSQTFEKWVHSTKENVAKAGFYIVDFGNRCFTKVEGMDRVAKFVSGILGVNDHYSGLTGPWSNLSFAVNNYIDINKATILFPRSLRLTNSNKEGKSFWKIDKDERLRIVALALLTIVSACDFYNLGRIIAGVGKAGHAFKLFKNGVFTGGLGLCINDDIKTMKKYNAEIETSSMKERKWQVLSSKVQDGELNSTDQVIAHYQAKLSSTASESKKEKYQEKIDQLNSGTLTVEDFQDKIETKEVSWGTRKITQINKNNNVKANILAASTKVTSLALDIIVVSLIVIAATCATSVCLPVIGVNVSLLAVAAMVKTVDVWVKVALGSYNLAKFTHSEYVVNAA